MNKKGGKMKAFEIKGTYTKNKEKHAFTKQVSADTEKLAREKVFAEIGGKNRVRRVCIEIAQIKGAK